MVALVPVSQLTIDQYSKTGRACIIPAFPHDCILLPPNAFTWLAEQTDINLSLSAVLHKSMQFEHTFLLPRLAGSYLGADTIKIDLTRHFGSLIPELLDEADAAFADMWGLDTEQWNEVCVFSTLMQIVARVGNRAFVGKPLCE